MEAKRQPIRPKEQVSCSKEDIKAQLCKPLTPEEKKEDISPEFLVETILNYGDIDATVQLFHLMGIKEVSKIFFNSITLSNRRKGNYQELTINYFTLVFIRYAH